jgi:hypothetical protein
MNKVSVDKILAERPAKHGEFEENSRATWAIMRALQAERNWPTLNDSMKHSLYMVAHKMARILAGDPQEPDHWDDIAGYAEMVAERLRTPIRPYDSDDIYSALARGWNMPREDVKTRVQAIMYERQHPSNGSAEGKPSAGTSKLSSGLPGGRSGAANDRPGTPEDGGQHGLNNIDELANELRAELDKEV